MTTFILLFITAAVFYYLGRHEQYKLSYKVIQHLMDRVLELNAELISQKEINK